MEELTDELVQKRLDEITEPQTREEYEARIAWLDKKVDEYSDQSRRYKYELADMLSPYSSGNVVAVTAKRWHGVVKEEFTQHWHVERVIPGRWRGQEFRLYGRIIKKDKTLGVNEREIPERATIVAYSLEEYLK